MHAGIALRDHGLYLGHAMAQALGGRYGLPHGALNAICLPAAMRFNACDGADRRRACRGARAALRVHAPARPRACRKAISREIAEATAVRGGAQANPRPASVEQIEELLLSVW